MLYNGAFGLKKYYYGKKFKSSYTLDTPVSRKGPLAVVVHTTAIGAAGTIELVAVGDQIRKVKRRGLVNAVVFAKGQRAIELVIVQAQIR
jgi:hypothetical protein